MTDAQKFAAALHVWTEKQKHDADLVRSLCRSIEQEVISKIPLMPESWDGHELRLYLSQKFAREVMQAMKDNSSRRRAYNKVVYAYDSPL